MLSEKFPYYFGAYGFNWIQCPEKKSVKSMAWNVRIDGEIKHEIVWIIWESKPNTAKKNDIAFAGIVKMC